MEIVAMDMKVSYLTLKYYGSFGMKVTVRV